MVSSPNFVTSAKSPSVSSRSGDAIFSRMVALRSETSGRIPQYFAAEIILLDTFSIGNVRSGCS